MPVAAVVPEAKPDHERGGGAPAGRHRPGPEGPGEGPGEGHGDPAASVRPAEARLGPPAGQRSAPGRAP